MNRVIDNLFRNEFLLFRPALFRLKAIFTSKLIWLTLYGDNFLKNLPDGRISPREEIYYWKRLITAKLSCDFAKFGNLKQLKHLRTYDEMN